MAQQLPLERPQSVSPAAPRESWTERNQRFVGLSLFVLKRLAFGLLVLVVIVFISFLGLDMARGVDFSRAFSYAADSTVVYFGNLLHGNLGYTSAGSITLRPIPVSSVLADVVPKSIALLTVSLLFATVIGILLGYLAGKRRNSNVSLVFILVSIIGVSI